MESYSESLGALPPVWLYGLAALLGLVLGSFLTVVIARLPVMLERGWRAACQEFLPPNQAAPADAQPPFNLSVPRSHCPHCKHTLSWHELVPLLSWLWQRGRCRHCGASIAWQYPLVEVLSVAAVVACAHTWGFSLTAVAMAGFCLALLALAMIDLRTFLLPDQITLPLLWAGLLCSVAGLVPVAPAQAILGAATGYASLWLLAAAYHRVTRREGMGHGDFKLLAALGAWLGLTALPTVILLASLLGLVSGVALIVQKRANRQTPMPFGPCLAAAGVGHLFLPLL